MKSIQLLGPEEQRQRWLPRLAGLEAFGAFGLTEPLHGSDSVAIEAVSRSP
jgi:glutaryl-CoA dehydrogenase